MITPTSFADVLRDWELLLEAANDNAEPLAAAQPIREALATTLVEARALKARQDSFSANRQQTTQELRELIDRGREEARRLRGLAKGLLGTKTERLVQFRVMPVRRTSRRRASSTPKKKVALGDEAAPSRSDSSAADRGGSR